MRIIFPCMYCAQKIKTSTNKTGNIISDILIPFQLNDDGIYITSCDKGHENIICLQEQKFEILFELGVIAYLDGYYIESVADFSSSLERFYEYYIKVISKKHGVDFNEFDQNWKLVTKQSERQLGAFLFLYIIENNESVEFIKDKYVKFRNNVIHKGHFPTKEEVNKYGEYVYYIIITNYNKLKKYGDIFKECVFEDIRKKQVKISNKKYIIYSSLNTIINSAKSKKGIKNFNQAIKELNEKRHSRYVK